jgi:formylglycine-generating enzyme required for sulfatase activity
MAYSVSKLFISYDRGNQPVVTVLARDMSDLGHTVWFDTELTGGHSWWEQILQQIRECEIFLFAVAPKSLDSVACTSEFMYANALGKPIVPILIAEGVSVNLLPDELAQIHFVEYLQLEDKRSALRLGNALNKIHKNGPLPDPLPMPPEVPTSYLGGLAKRVSAASLNYEQQATLIMDIKTSLRDPLTRDDSITLLERLNDRPDLLMKTGQEIEELLRVFEVSNSQTLAPEVQNDSIERESEATTESKPEDFTNTKYGSKTPAKIPLAKEDARANSLPTKKKILPWVMGVLVLAIFWFGWFFVANKDNLNLQNISTEVIPPKDQETTTQAEVALLDEKQNSASEDSINSTTDLMQNELSKLLSVCDSYAESQRLTSGKGGNSLDCYQSVLALSPDNQRAIGGIENIEKTYAIWITSDIDRGDVEKAKLNLKSLKDLNANSPLVVEIETELANKIKLIELREEERNQQQLAAERKALKEKEPEAEERKRLALDLQRKKKEEARLESERTAEDMLSQQNKPVISTAQLRSEPKNFTKSISPLESIEQNMVFIRGGTFNIGSEEAESGRDNDEDQALISVANYRISKFEVTQEQWRSVMGVQHSSLKGCAACPVENVNWKSVKEFFEKLNLLTSRNFRLPTEAEWEYAARAGTSTPFNTGDCIDTEKANFYGGSRYGSCTAQGIQRGRAVRVGSYKPNSLGLFDMHGNVQEWTCSVYSKQYRGRESKCKLGNAGSLVVRGGAWNGNASSVRSANRILMSVSRPAKFVGFRIAEGI